MPKSNLLKHEEFDVSNPAEHGRAIVVREDRIAPTSPCFVLVGRNQYQVLDFSSYGFSIQSLHKVDFDSLEPVSFKYGDLVFEELICRKVFESKNEQDEYKTGFEITVNSLDMETVVAYQVSADLQPVVHEILTKTVEIPSEFKYRTLELKERLALVRKEINDASSRLYSRNSMEFNAKVETVFGRFFGIFLRDSFMAVLNHLEAVLANEDVFIRKRSMEYFREELADFIFSAPFVHRVYHKPFQYAGDFEMMNHIYKNEPVGKDLFAKCLHKAILEAPASQAVRNRAHYLHGKLKDAISKKSGRLKIFAVASGPAMEIQLLIKDHPELASRADFFLLDQDLGALKQTKTELLRLAKASGITLSVNYVNKAVANIIEEGVDQPYDLIYSAGLFDYFGDKYAFLVGKALFDGLAPKGELIIGNFNAINPSRFLMECVGDWHLKHRSEEDLMRVYSPVTRDLRIEAEEQNINLFVILKNQ